MWALLPTPIFALSPSPTKFPGPPLNRMTARQSLPQKGLGPAFHYGAPPESPAAGLWWGHPRPRPVPREPSVRCRQAGPEWTPLSQPPYMHFTHVHTQRPSRGTAPEPAMWIFVAGLSELLFSDPWVGQMEEGDQEARVGKQLGLQRGCGLAVPGRRLTSVRAPTPPSLQREQPWRRW